MKLTQLNQPLPVSGQIGYWQQCRPTDAPSILHHSFKLNLTSQSNNGFLFLLPLLLVLLLLLQKIAGTLPSPAIKAGYWQSWTNLTFPSSDINFTFFTHVFYAFLEPNPTDFTLLITPDHDLLLSNFTHTLPTHQPPITALLSIGGGASNATTFARLASTPAKRSAFINSSIATARRYNLDGLDLDWEFPANDTDMFNLGLLFTEWRAAVEQEAAATHRPRLLLSAAVHYSSNFSDGDIRSYPSDAMIGALDWISAMCFDYYGRWNTSFTGEHAALTDTNSNFSTEYGIRSWISSGVPARMLVMGVPMYGRTWRLKDPADHRVGSPAVGLGPGDDEGIIGYSGVVEFNSANNATVETDSGTGSVYSYAGTSWIGFEDPTSVARKVEFARGLGLGGYFFWELGSDSNWSVSSRASMTWDTGKGPTVL